MTQVSRHSHIYRVHLPDPNSRLSSPFLQLVQPPAPRVRLPWDAILLVLKEADASTLAVLGRVSFDVLVSTAPLLYRDVEVKSIKALEGLFCEREEEKVSSRPFSRDPFDLADSFSSSHQRDLLPQGSIPTSPFVNSKPSPSTFPIYPAPPPPPRPPNPSICRTKGSSRDLSSSISFESRSHPSMFYPPSNLFSSSSTPSPSNTRAGTRKRERGVIIRGWSCPESPSSTTGAAWKLLT